MSDLTLEQLITNNATQFHIRRVGALLHRVLVLLLVRIDNHDVSKLENPELDIFTKYTPKLAECTYGSPEYDGYLKEMKVALDHHYLHNRHHPEFHKFGVSDMTLIDLLEMLCDWKAASERHNDGDIHKSIRINAYRFNIDSQLSGILNNTVSVLFKDD